MIEFFFLLLEGRSGGDQEDLAERGGERARESERERERERARRERKRD